MSWRGNRGRGCSRSRRSAYRRGLSIFGVPAWSVGLMAVAGAWIGHFVEYVRVAGWHSGVGQMGSSVHTYFFPAGAAITAVLFGLAFLARRAWRALGRRIRTAEVSLWKRPLGSSGGSANEPSGAVNVAGLWLVLTVLQTLTWVLQENLEAMSAGQRAPVLGVLSGVHWLAPVIQAEVALILAALYSLVRHWFAGRRSRLVVLERLVARRWQRRFVPVAFRVRAARVCSTPLERWGRQRWQRPPPLPVASVI